MSLTIPAVPQEAVTALATLPKLATSPAVAYRLPQAAAAARRFMTAHEAISLPFFVLDLSDVRNGIMPAGQVGWRHLLPTGDPAGLVLAETAIRDSNQHVFTGVTDSPFVSDLEFRLISLLADPAVSAGSYDAALLQVPAMGVMAIWLQDTVHHHDLITPLAPAPPSLTAGRQYSTAQFLDTLRALGRLDRSWSR
jgi:hypothetical protein